MWGGSILQGCLDLKCFALSVCSDKALLAAGGKEFFRTLGKKLQKGV